MSEIHSAASQIMTTTLKSWNFTNSGVFPTSNEVAMAAPRENGVRSETDSDSSKHQIYQFRPGRRLPQLLQARGCW